MTTGRLFVCMGAFAAILAAAVFTNQSSRNANAQQSTTDQTQIDQNQANQSEQNRTGQTQTNQYRSRAQAGSQALSSDPNKRPWKASELVGMDVRGKSGDDEIGEISDVMIGPNGRIRYVAVSFGGFLGLGDKLFAVPWKAVQFVREGEDEDDVYARIDVTEEQLRAKRGFNQDNWPMQPDETFLQGQARAPRQVERPRPGTQNENAPRR